MGFAIVETVMMAAVAGIKFNLRLTRFPVGTIPEFAA